jgi:two-component system, NtrC family, sensor histidine kinase PilS
VIEDDRIILANRAAESLLAGGLEREAALLGKNIRDVTRLGQRFENWIKRRDMGPQTFTHPNSGAEIQVQFSRLDRQGSDQVLAYLEDTRHLRQRAQQMKLESLSRLSAGLAHEVRNPLSAVSQANQLLQQSRHLNAEDRGFIDIIDRHCQRMNEIIDVVQQLSRRIEPSIRTIALQPFLEELTGEINESRSVPATIELNVPEDALIRFDPGNLKQVLGNIIDNGLRHSELETGHALVRINLGSHRSDRGQFLDIHDLGPGIPRHSVRQIFDPFFTTAHQGSGLGLYIARELCEVNFATVHYLYPDPNNDKGFFRVSFSPMADE